MWKWRNDNHKQKQVSPFILSWLDNFLISSWSASGSSFKLAKHYLNIEINQVLMHVELHNNYSK